MPQHSKPLASALAVALLALSAPWSVALAQPEGEAPPAAAPAPPATQLGDVVKEQQGANQEAKAAQDRINEIDDETQKLLTAYRTAVAEAESIAAYTDQLKIQVDSQEQELASIQQQLDEVETTSREILPLMQRMLDTLDQFVALDVPFLLDERKKRVATLKEVMNRADVSISEKYRRILEAYQIEMEYGRTLEAYEGRVGEGDKARTLQFLRLGRVALMYQTLDGKETGYWDNQKRDWIVDDHYEHAFKEGIRVAKKLGAPDLMIVPIAAPTKEKS
jgi:hypothetical protein